MPFALAGRDVLGVAQTGTGKTAAFVLPILQRFLSGGRAGPRALVVTPTRELAAQVNVEFERLARYTPLTSTAVFGGVPLVRQVQALRRRPTVVVACPGRLLDLLDRGCLHLDRIEVLVLDDADHLLDMGFLPDLRRILAALPRHRQNLLFSATMPCEIRRLADSVLTKPAVVDLAHSQPAETIDHAVFSVAEDQKVLALERLLEDGAFRSAIVFLRTKRRTKRLVQQLGRGRHQVVTLQGNMSQAQRGRALRGFREGRFDVLVATDVAARGSDIAGVSHVVNFDVPNTPDAYTHRVGRTGRSGLAGTAFTLATPGDGAALRAIEKRFGKAIPGRSLDELGFFGSDAHGGAEARCAAKSPRGSRSGKTPRLRVPGGSSIREAAPARPAAFGQGAIDVPSRRA
jgi:ATP-dependent RNA helicase RhlE